MTTPPTPRRSRHGKNSLPASRNGTIAGRLLLALSLLALTLFSMGMSPAPKPTPVIAGLAVQKNDGWYVSPLFPYRMKTTWHGTIVVQDGDKLDKLTHGKSVVYVISVRNATGVTTRLMVEYVLADLAQSGLTPSIGATIHLDHQMVPVIFTQTNQNALGIVLFADPTRAWQLTLVGDLTTQTSDRAAFVAMLRSFRLG